MKKYEIPTINYNEKITLEYACLIAQLCAETAIKTNANRSGHGVAIDIEKSKRKNKLNTTLKLHSDVQPEIEKLQELKKHHLTFLTRSAKNVTQEAKNEHKEIARNIQKRINELKVHITNDTMGTPSLDSDDIIQSAILAVCQLYKGEIITSQSQKINDIQVRISNDNNITYNDIRAVAFWKANNVIHKERQPKYTKISIEKYTEDGGIIKYMDELKQEREILANAVNEFINSLPEKYKETILLRSEGMTLKAIGEIQNIRKQNVDKCIKYVQKKAKEYFTDDIIQCFYDLQKALDTSTSVYIQKPNKELDRNGALIVRYATPQEIK